MLPPPLRKPGCGVLLRGALYRGESDRWGSNCVWLFDDTEETKFSVRERDAWIFLVRTSKTSLKFAPTSASFPCNMTTTLSLCSPS